MNKLESCSKCSCVMRRTITMPAKTASLWGVDWRDGLSSNLYSKALGRQVSSKREEEKIMRAKGFVPESDFGEGFIDKQREKMQAKVDKQEAINKSYIDNLNKFDGDKLKAVEHTFPAHEMLKEE